MLRTTFFFLFIFGLSAMANSKTIDIREAVKSGWVTLTVEANGGHSGKTIRIRVQNLKKKKFQLYVPVGLVFTSVDSTEQDLIIIQERLLALDKKQKRTFTLYGMCIQANNSSPRKESLFELSTAESSDNLMKLTAYIDKNALRTSAAQYAIWAVTDNKRVENIGERDLAIFTAELLGKPIPTYYIRHARQSRPGQMAFIDNPSTIEGKFKYKSDEMRKVSFGMYGADGKLLYTAFENQEQKAGHHKFKFLFEVRNIPKGKYYARLMSEGEILKELAVEF